MQPPSKPSSTTVADVARAAGVSKATAARVLGGYGTVSDRIRELVKAAAAELDYRPNEIARSMTTGRSGTIGVVVGDIENPYFGMAVRGITDVARLSGFNVVLSNSGESVASEKAAIRTLMAKRVDGLIVSPAHETDIDHLREIEASGRPLALLDRAVAAMDVDTAVADDREAAEGIARLLVGLGHRRIAYLTACDTPDHIFRSPADLYTASVRQRVEGYLQICRAAGLAEADTMVRLGARGPAAAQRQARALLSAADRPTAIIASDSLIGLEVFKAARELGLRLPEDLSLVSFHDADWASVTSPPVTVIRQPVYELGEVAARLLIDRLNGKSTGTRNIVLPTTLIERQSTGPVGPAPPRAGC